MGNVMIQPTMFFYLKNIPMFKGTYWITEVGHEIRNNNIVTKFKGSRMPYTALPDLTDSFMSSYRTLFDKLQQKAINRVNGSDKVTETSASIVTADGSQYTYDMGPDKKKVTGEKVTLDDVGVTVNGIPYNGFNEFTIKVTDTGIGMTKQQATAAFEQYTQVDEDSERAATGTGLGLPLAKHLVEMMNGTIEVESEKGVGSSFIVKFICDNKLAHGEKYIREYVIE
jgi:hypothetical protein